jgi:hypothetical protein
MAAPRSSPLLLAALLALGAAGCRGATPQPVTRAEQPKEAPKETQAPAAAPSSPKAPEPSAPAAAPPRQGDAAPVVVDPGVDGRTEPQTLVEASRAEKERRAGAGKPVAVINDKTLPRYASKGQITVADPKKDKKKPAAAPAAAPAVKDEQYWRGRARELRESWKQAADEVKDLEQKSTALRQKFYSESDTFLRDTQIKPDWDRVLDRLRQARQEVETAKQELATFLEEGRSAGALPGWLDEGVEDEPADEAARKKEPVPAVQSIEPPVIDNDAARTPPPGPEAPR